MDMTMKDIAIQLEDPIEDLSTYLARARYVMADIMEDFFGMTFDPKKQSEWWKVAAEYNRCAVRAGIVEDALAHIEAVAEILKQLERRIDEQSASAQQKEAV